MADIDVVKNGTPIWVWILIALLVVLAVLFFFGRDRSHASTRFSPAAPEVVAMAAAGVSLPVLTV